MISALIWMDIFFILKFAIHFSLSSCPRSVIGRNLAKEELIYSDLVEVEGSNNAGVPTFLDTITCKAEK